MALKSSKRQPVFWQFGESMKQARAVVTSLMLVGAMVTACATSSDDAVEATPGPAVAAEAGSIKVNGDAASTPPLETGVTPSKVCASNCKTDSECQSSCPAAPNGGLNCCDTSSGVCYASSSSSCGGVDGGAD